MLFGFFGRVSNAPALREGLDASSQRVRMIAHRVAGASLPGGAAAAEFSLPEQPDAPSKSADLEAEMTALANEQLRFEASAKLLEQTYQRIRLSLRER